MKKTKYYNVYKVISCYIFLIYHKKTVRVDSAMVRVSDPTSEDQAFDFS